MTQILPLSNNPGLWCGFKTTVRHFQMKEAHDMWLTGRGHRQSLPSPISGVKISQRCCCDISYNAHRSPFWGILVSFICFNSNEKVGTLEERERGQKGLSRKCVGWKYRSQLRGVACSLQLILELIYEKLYQAQKSHQHEVLRLATLPQSACPSVFPSLYRQLF